MAAVCYNKLYDTVAGWRLSLARDLGTEIDDPHRVRELAHLYARATGPTVADVRFTPSGFSDYLASLLVA